MGWLSLLPPLELDKTQLFLQAPHYGSCSQVCCIPVSQLNKLNFKQCLSPTQLFLPLHCGKDRWLRAKLFQGCAACSDAQTRGLDSSENAGCLLQGVPGMWQLMEPLLSVSSCASVSRTLLLCLLFQFLRNSHLHHFHIALLWVDKQW